MNVFNEVYLNVLKKDKKSDIDLIVLRKGKSIIDMKKRIENIDDRNERIKFRVEIIRRKYELACIIENYFLKAH